MMMKQYCKLYPNYPLCKLGNDGILLEIVIYGSIDRLIYITNKLQNVSIILENRRQKIKKSKNQKIKKSKNQKIKKSKNQKIKKSKNQKIKKSKNQKKINEF